MAEFRFTLPELEVQQAIAEVLSALDDKIAANSHVVAEGRGINVCTVQSVVR